MNNVKEINKEGLPSDFFELASCILRFIEQISEAEQTKQEKDKGVQNEIK